MDSQVSTIGTFLLGKWDYIIAYISIMLIFQDCYVKAVVSCFVFFPSSRLHLSSESPTFYRVLLKLHSQRVIVWECSKYNGNEKKDVCLLLYREARVLFIAYSYSLYKFLQNFFFFFSFTASFMCFHTAAHVLSCCSLCLFHTLPLLH